MRATFSKRNAVGTTQATVLHLIKRQIMEEIRRKEILTLNEDWLAGSCRGAVLIGRYVSDLVEKRNF